MTSRREFMQQATAVLGLPLLAAQPAAAKPPELPAPKTGSDVGSLFPFIQSQVVQQEFPLAYLCDEVKDLPEWKKQARGKLLELLHYAPPKCDPRPEVVETVDRGEYVREKIFSNTTPDVRVPAYVLVPKKKERPLPALVALH